MMVEREGFPDFLAPHYFETHRIDETEDLIELSKPPVSCFGFQISVYRDNFVKWIRVDGIEQIAPDLRPA